jgi:hypothetical protein
LEPSRVSFFFDLAPEPVVLADFDGRGDGEVFSSLEVEVDGFGGGLARGEREVHMDDSSSELSCVMGLETAPAQGDRVSFYSWHLFEVLAKAVRDGGLKRIRSTRSWHCRESLLRATETIRILFSYLYLFGGGAWGGGAEGAGLRVPILSVFKTRSRRAVFSLIYAQRVFYVLWGRFFVPGFRHQDARPLPNLFRGPFSPLRIP